ncbi:MAG: hypothetical protein ACRC2J_16190 [Microcoleaceae cyanobacterium]
MVWSLPPFLVTGKNPVNITARYFSLLGTATAGVICLVSSQYLKKTSPIIIASSKASENLLINQLASSQFMQQQYYQVLAKELPPILANQAIDQSLAAAHDVRSHIPGQENINNDFPGQEKSEKLGDVNLAIAAPDDNDLLPPDLMAVLNLAIESQGLTIRELQRSQIGRKMGLTSDGAKYAFEKLADLGYGELVAIGKSLKFIPNDSV